LRSARTRTVASDFLLLLAALIWGVAFVPQRTAMEHLGPFTFTGVRVAMGALALCPFLLWWRGNGGGPTAAGPDGSVAPVHRVHHLGLWTGAPLTGLFLFTAVSLQQIGMIYTTAGKAGFISGLYVVVVAILGLLWRQFPPLGTWLGAAVAVAGLYLLVVPDDWSVNRGDLLVLASIIFWAGQILLIGYLSGHVRVLPLAIVEFATCALLSLVVAALQESIAFDALVAAWRELLYTGLLSAGVAYTLQIAGQKGAPPAHAAIIMSLETVFAALAGWLLLGGDEVLPATALLGCGLMLAGMIISQLAQTHAARQLAPARQPGAPPPHQVTTLTGRPGMDPSGG